MRERETEPLTHLAFPLPLEGFPLALPFPLVLLPFSWVLPRLWVLAEEDWEASLELGCSLLRLPFFLGKVLELLAAFALPLATLSGESLDFALPLPLGATGAGKSTSSLHLPL